MCCIDCESELVYYECIDLFELFRRQLIQTLQLAQALSVTLVEPEEICSTVLQQVQDQAQAGCSGVCH